MINRRHIRIKVMQAAYALLLAEDDNLTNQERYLKQSIDQLHDLYIFQLKLLIELVEKAEKNYEIHKKKHLQTDSPLRK